MASGNNVNFDVVQGETFSLQIAYTDEDKNPIDITGMIAIFTVVNEPEGDYICATGSMGDGVEISNPTTGIIDVVISPEKTKKFTLPRAYCEVKLIDEQQDFADILFVGWFKVSPGAKNNG